MAESFTHLHVHTEFSMLDGAARVNDVVAKAAADGQPAIGITDHGNMYGILDFWIIPEIRIATWYIRFALVCPLLLGVFLVAFPGALRVHDATMPYATQALIGCGILAAIAVYLLACARQTGPLNILGWTLPVPTLRQALIQFALAATDIAIASAALLVLLPPEAWHHYPDFLVAYVVAVVVALLAHAPGGIGVFEAVVLVTLPEVDKPSLISALILYRLMSHR